MALRKENKLVQLKTIRKEELRKNILRLIPYAWWRKRLEHHSTVKFRDGRIEGGCTYEVTFAVDKNKKHKETKEGEETNNDVPLFRGKDLRSWYQDEGLEIDDECVLEYVDSHTVKYHLFHRKNYPGFSSPVLAGLGSSVPTNSSHPLPSSSFVPSCLVEFTDLASFKSLFLKDRECAQPISEFPEDRLEVYYRLCLLEKRLIHGKVYERLGLDIGDAFIEKMVWVFEKADPLLRSKVGDVTHKELDELLVSVKFFETINLDLGVLGKCLRDVKSIKDNIDQMMVKYEEITRPVVESIDEVLRKE